jgi:flagellar FliL protein
MYKRYIAHTIFALAMLVSTPTWAETEQTGPQLAYFTLEPDLTTNFYTKGKKLGYVQVRIDIMVMSQQDLAIVEHHQPLIRDAIIELLGKQTEDTIKSLSGREDLRKTLVTSLNETLLPETGKTVIADLLFTKYLYQ